MANRDMAALIFVDVQRDFCTGSLAVPGAEAQLPKLQDLLDKAEEKGYHWIILTGDSHPANHSSFKEQGGPWPSHCVEGTPGAEILLDVTKVKKRGFDVHYIWKGRGVDGDAYSAFEKKERRCATGQKSPRRSELGQLLESLDAYEVDICGWAFDYCVKHTALDAAALGYQVTVLQDLCSAVDPKSIDKVKAELEGDGCVVAAM